MTSHFPSGAVARLASLWLLISVPCYAWADAAWKDGDVGQVTMSGSANVNDHTGALTIKGGGSDIWDTADAFHYVYQTVSGDAELIAHLDSMDNTADWAKVGLMVRQDKSESSVYAMIFQSAMRGIAFQARTKANGHSILTNAQNNGAPIWLRIVKDGNVVSGYDSPDGLNWTCRNVVRLPFNGPAKIGMAVCSRTDNSLCTAIFDHVLLVSDKSYAPQASWSEKDIGETPIPGGVHCEKDECNIFASGQDIWDNSDGFHELVWTSNGNTDVVVHVNNIIDTDSSAKAGIMFRANDSPGSPQVSLVVTPDDGLYFIRRKVQDAKCFGLSLSAKTPLWLKLERHGDIFSAFRSVDGTNWKPIGKDTVVMDHSLEVGLVLAPKKTDSLGEVSFSHLSVDTLL